MLGRQRAGVEGWLDGLGAGDRLGINGNKWSISAENYIWPAHWTGPPDLNSLHTTLKANCTGRFHFVNKPPSFWHLSSTKLKAFLSTFHFDTLWSLVFCSFYLKNIANVKDRSTAWRYVFKFYKSQNKTSCMSNTLGNQNKEQSTHATATKALGVVCLHILTILNRYIERN